MPFQRNNQQVFTRDIQEIPAHPPSLRRGDFFVRSTKIALAQKQKVKDKSRSPNFDRFSRACDSTRARNSATLSSSSRKRPTQVVFRLFPQDTDRDPRAVLPPLRRGDFFVRSTKLAQRKNKGIAILALLLFFLADRKKKYRRERC